MLANVRAHASGERASSSSGARVAVGPNKGQDLVGVG